MTDPIHVLIRRLPSGTAQSCELLRMAGARLELLLQPGSEELAAGALVEAECGPMLYLGQIQSVSGRTVSVFVEHSLDLNEVATFRKRWRLGRTDATPD